MMKRQHRNNQGKTINVNQKIQLTDYKKGGLVVL